MGTVFVVTFIAFVVVGETFFPDKEESFNLCDTQQKCEKTRAVIERDKYGNLTNETVSILFELSGQSAVLDENADENLDENSDQ